MPIFLLSLFICWHYEFEQKNIDKFMVQQKVVQNPKKIQFFHKFYYIFNISIALMSDTIKEYFRRFDDSITQSVYSNITIDDFYRNKSANQYLDYDKDSLFRKNKLYSGIRNIDNSCYLSATLQILYNIQWLRERIFRVPENSLTDFLREIQKLFALMHKGSLIYVDPTNLFTVLKKLHPDVFIPGSQNDFHQVFTIILDELEKSLINDDDKRFFKKMFYGKMKVQLTDQKGKISNNSFVDTGNSFNLINLTSANKNFDVALKNFKNQIIDGYVNDSGQKMKASKEINFLETPAILSFFINRVSFKDKKLVKDSSQFEFEQKILFCKTSSSKIVKSTDTQIQKQILELSNWMNLIKEKKQLLLKALTYFEENQFTSINIPNIPNPLGEQAKNSAKKYLTAQVETIDKQTSKCLEEINFLQKRRIKQAEQTCSEPYNIWAVMIHCGSTAESGHYKICIKVDALKNGWVQFNDRRTEQISYQKILEYKKKGQICCLFYKRSSLVVTQPEKAQISTSLKKYVQEEEQKIFKKIDDARILQSLYQQYESVNIIWQHQNLLLRQQQPISTYFFNPLLHLILTGTSALICKAFLLYQTIQQQKFLISVQNKLIDKNRELIVPSLDFGIPSQYWNIYQALKQFMCLQVNSPLEAYELISFYTDVSITNKITNKIFGMFREVLVLKGIFYESLFVEFNLLPTYDDFSKTIDRILNAIGMNSNFSKIVIPIRQTIRQKYLTKIMDDKMEEVGLLKKQSSLAPMMIKQIGPVLFSKRFGYWIDQRKNLDKYEYIQNYDEIILQEYKKYYSIYILNGK